MLNARDNLVLGVSTFVVLTAMCGAVHAGSGGQRDRFMSRSRQLLFEGRRAGEGYFSPDGTKLILQAERHPGNPFFQIYTLDLVSGHSRLVSPGVGYTTCSFFRPGTNEVLFASTHLDPQAREKQRREYEERPTRASGHTPFVYDEHFDIFSSDRRGRNLRRLTDTLGYDAEGSYSPDGKLIAFCSLRNAYPLEKLTEKERELLDEQPEYFGELYIMNADGSNQRRLTNWKGYDGGPFFTPDGERVIWRHFEENGLIADIYTIKIDGSDMRRLTDFKTMSWAPYMHASNEYAIFVSNKLGFANFELYIVDALGEKEPVRVTYTNGFDGLAVFSPDGNTLAWTTNRTTMESRTGQLFIADWDHDAALAAVKAAPPRGTPEKEPSFDQPPKTTWPHAGPPPVRAGCDPVITADDLYEHVRYLAADELEGRMTGTQGARNASEYIAARFRDAGLEPAGDDGTYFQAFTFPEDIEVVPQKNEFAIVSPGGGPAHTFEVDEDYRPLSFATNAEVKGEVVCVGYGLVVPEEPGKKKYDSYEGVDVKDKVVLVFDDVPVDVHTDERIRLSHYSGLRYKAKQAQKHGAVGLLLVVGPNTPGAGELIPLTKTGSDAGIVAASITTKAAQRLLDGAGVKLGELQGLLDKGEVSEHFNRMKLNAHVQLTTHLTRSQGQCRNVIGLLPGVGEGEVADEYVLIGAHYDHIGHGEAGGSLAHAGQEGQIHNGADDNASGVATVLELAAAFGEQRRGSSGMGQARGLIFAAWSGEEIGVVGSSHFVRHAPCPLGQIAAYVNFDMVGRLRDGRLILQGIGSSQDWHRLIEKVNIRVPLAILLQDDPYLPTDTHEFYPAGVPILAFFTGAHDDYNRPTDDADTLNYAGMHHIARFGKHMVTELAVRPARPRYKSVESSTPQGRPTGRRSIYTGTVPDFSAADTKGMKISGVQGGSPAEKAGLIGGDVIIGIAGHEIGGLQDYATILRALKPDETVEMIVVRDGNQLRLAITPTARK